jgi:predicted dehydrogenase
MTPAPPIRFAIVGAGSIAVAHAAAIRTIAGARLVGVTDTNLAVGQAFGTLHETTVFESIDALIDGARPGIIVICTPPSTHRDLALRAIAAGCHVLCEKPLALDPVSATEMLDAAADAGLILTMATKFRYVADVIRARNMIKLGVLGRIELITNEFRSPVSMETRWNSNPSLSGGGVFIDNGTHSVDVLRYLAGPLESISVTAEASKGALIVEDNAQALVRCSSGTFARIELSWAQPAASPYYVQIVGTQGRVAIGWKESLFRLGRENDWRPLGTGYDKLAAFEGQYQNITDVLAGRATIEVGRDDALSSVRAVAAGYASMKNRRWESVDGVEANDESTQAERAMSLL